MSRELQQWIDGFEKEINKRFETNLKLVLIDRSNLKSVQTIASVCASVSGIDERLLQEKTRKSIVVNVRQVCMSLAMKYLNVSSIFVGNYFNRDHTTVLHAIATVNDRIYTNDYETTALLNECEQKIKEILEHENHE